MPTKQSALRFQPRLWAAIIHLLLFAGVFVLFMGRKPGVFRWQAAVDLLPGFYTHVFNFALSYLFLAGVGFLWVMAGVSVRHMAMAALALVLANIAYEFLLPLLNTRDPVDALYGVVGTLFAFAWMWVVQRFGLRPVPESAT